MYYYNITQMIEKKFINQDMNLELISYIDNKQNVWFKGKGIAQILGYNDTDQAIRTYVSEEHKKKCYMNTPSIQRGNPEAVFINEPGFYELVFNSKLDSARIFRQWVFTYVLPSIRKYSFYELFDNPNNKMFKIGNETDLHIKVVEMIRKCYSKAFMIAGLGELQDTSDKRKQAWKKGY